MKAYFFDLDGTLTDAREGLYFSFRAALKALDLPELSDQELDRFLGTPLPEMFRILKPGISKAEIVAGINAFRSAYESGGIQRNRLYPGVPEMLNAIVRKGSGVWIVTSKPEFYAVRVTQDLKIDGYLQGVIGAGLDETNTKGELVARALVAAGVAGDDAIMLGDRYYDVVGALENGVMPVGALWGYGSYEELHSAGCRHFAASPHEFRMNYVEADVKQLSADRRTKRLRVG
jgi:phosphoglycolate phosphatase